MSKMREVTRGGRGTGRLGVGLQGEGEGEEKGWNGEQQALKGEDEEWMGSKWIGDLKGASKMEREVRKGEEIGREKVDIN